MVFVDVLAFEIVTLLLVAALVAYGAILGLVSYRREGGEGLKTAMKSLGMPVGALGVVATGLGVWGEAAWPLPGSYNILFSDVYLLMGLVLVGFAAVILAGLKLQYAGVLSLVAGAATMDYGVSGYQLGLTKEPIAMLALYGAFGLAAILAFPAALVADRLMAGTLGSERKGTAATATGVGRFFGSMGRRAAQPVVPGAAARSGGSASTDITVASTSETTTGTASRGFAVPPYAQALVIAFAFFAIAAGIVAVIFLDSTVPAHLAHAP